MLSLQSLRGRILTFICLAVLSGIYILANFPPYQMFGIRTPNISKKAGQPKSILFWTYVFGEPFNYFTNEDFGKRCLVSNCIFLTGDRSGEVARADAVIFHGRDLGQDVPKVRRSFQKYVIFNLESEFYQPRLSVSGMEHGFFNYTMTYRLDSDVVHSYGHYEKIENPKVNVSVNYAQGKTKMAAWFVSNCKTSSRREDLVTVLSKYIDIDIYGGCGHLNCPKSVNGHCMDMVEKKYKFYLSFENSLCPDYVTEKFFVPLMHNIVPVVYGGADYSLFAPPNSYIDVNEFVSVKDLADYLKLFDRNDELYNRYFDWKTEYRVVRNDDGWCNLCAKLNDENEPPKTYKNVNKWWNTGRCVRDKTWI